MNERDKKSVARLTYVEKPFGKPTIAGGYVEYNTTQRRGEIHVHLACVRTKRETLGAISRATAAATFHITKGYAGL